ncbi:SrpA-related protein [Dissulfuribacter thermophilus]|uniref:SrpA-related protein n=2 Tax=Dissulfuribacter thermophilus TaxID=1156395 RepID=A0A1B9F8U7_9BACT|nr:SrpA-related protein [Dissulfuribacter thermophilus]
MKIGALNSSSFPNLYFSQQIMREKDKTDPSSLSAANKESGQVGLKNVESKNKIQTESASQKKASVFQREKLSPQEIQELFKLKQRDREVKQHEMAHIAAGGIYVRGGATFEYKMGPDGKRYAVAGEVSIDVSEEANPRKTLQKMYAVQHAALAPAHPSAQDRRVAVLAAAKAIEAMVKIMKEMNQLNNPDKMQTSSDEKTESGTRIDLYA